MAKNLGTVKLNDDKALLAIVAEEMPGVEEYFNTSATWSKAEQSMNENGQDSTEVRINGLDFIFVERPSTQVGTDL